MCVIEESAPNRAIWPVSGPPAFQNRGRVTSSPTRPQLPGFGTPGTLHRHFRNRARSSHLSSSSCCTSSPPGMNSLVRRGYSESCYRFSSPRVKVTSLHIVTCGNQIPAKFLHLFGYTLQQLPSGLAAKVHSLLRHVGDHNTSVEDL